MILYKRKQTNNNSSEVIANTFFTGTIFTLTRRKKHKEIVDDKLYADFVVVAILALKAL